MKLEILDSTLRDGSQAEGISFSVQDKIHIVKALDAFGVDYIEAGNPGSNPKDLQFFEEIQNLHLKRAKLCAFGSTRRYSVTAEEDANLQSILQANTPAVSIFGKAWDLHVTEILGITLPQNLEIVEDTLAYLKACGKEVIFDAEHFFDGYKANHYYAMDVLAAAQAGGADCLCLCDTNGGCLPDEIAEITAEVVRRFPDIKIGIHCHDDIGCAVANTLSAVTQGAVHVQGTFVGFGERCGNADLSIVLPNLVFKCGLDYAADLTDLTAIATYISEVANIRIRGNKPYTGKSAFAHKGGMHIDGVIKLSQSFEHISPESVGNTRKFLTSEVAGKSSILPKIQEFLPELHKNSPETAAIIALLKEKECFGYQYEAAQASFELLVKKELNLWQPHFDVVFFKTGGDYTLADSTLRETAIVQINVGGELEVAGALGNGPV
ncbi:MAG: citramalate synthase, partial [Clostridiales bacterium]|nr:citramalate synthase [Clostridiales bacterium]